MNAIQTLQDSLFADDEFDHPQAQISQFPKGPATIYEHLIAQDKKRRNKIQSLEQRDQVDNRQLDGFGFDLDDSVSRVTKYASGVLSPAYWKAYKASGRPLCVAATELGDTRLERVKKHVANGGTLMVDSGAFIYKDRPQAMPWHFVANRYYEIARAASADANVTFILPDVLGDQDASLEALDHWGNRLIKTVGPHHECLLPVQNGDREPGQYIREAAHRLKERFSGIAIPCGAVPMPPEKLKGLRSLDAEQCPQRIHLLGISNRKKALSSYTTVLDEVWPQAGITCDAVEFRQDVGKDEVLTLMRAEIMDAIRTKALELVDWTELKDDLKDRAMVKLHEYADRHFPTFQGAGRKSLLLQLQQLPVGEQMETEAFHELLDQEYGPYATSMATHALITHKVPRLLNDYWANHAPLPGTELPDEEAQHDELDSLAPQPA